MEPRYIIKLFGILLIIKLASSRTVTHTETKLKSNGDRVTRTWSTTEGDDAAEAPLGPFPVLITPESEPTAFPSVDLKPYRETIRIGGSNPDVLRKQAALAKGMDPTAIAELMATKQPVIRTSIDEKGDVRTTTYELEPNGSISSKTTIHIKSPPVTYFALNRNTASSPDTQNWEWHTPRNPEPKWPEFPSQNWPDLDANPVERRLNPNKATDVQLPESWNPKLWGTHQKPYFNFNTNPDVDLFEPRKTTSLHFNDKDPFQDENNDPFGSFGVHPPGISTKPTTDSNGITVKTTFTGNNKPIEWIPIVPDEYPLHSLFVNPSPSTTPKTIINWPSRVPTTTINTISAEKPNVFSLTEPEKPLPSLEDILKSGAPTQPTVQKSTTYTPLSTVPSTKPTNPTPYDVSNATSQKPVATINVDDLPVTEVLKNGKPVEDGDILSTLPSEFRPTLLAPTQTTYKVQNIPRTPTLEDFEPNIRDRLVNAGITNDDLKHMQGDEITKVNVGPDGKITRTTIKMRVVPQPYNHTYNPKHTGTPDFIPTNFDKTEFPVFPPYEFPSYEFPVDPWNTKTPIYITPRTVQNVAETTPKPTPCISKNEELPKNPIDAFLHRLDLAAADLSSNHGEWLKTIVDENGRVLTVKLLLSDIVDGSAKQQEKATPRPLK